jgi:hypothetical protein
MLSMAKRASEGAISSSKIKKLMQEDEDVGAVAEKGFAMVGKTVELFVADLVAAAAVDARARGSAVINIADVQAAVSRAELFDFLREAVDSVAESIPPVAPKGKGKRQKRADASDDD